MPWNDPPCGHPDCDQPADIICTSLDGPEPYGRGFGLTMALCVQHFWDWNRKSLERRGHLAASLALEDLLEDDAFQDPAPDYLHQPSTHPREMV